jgi:hypothetical protein
MQVLGSFTFQSMNSPTKEPIYALVKEVRWAPKLVWIWRKRVPVPARNQNP